MSISIPKKKNWASHQKRWYGKWHVWLGLIAGTVIFIVSLTGTILVYRDEIDAALNPEIFKLDEGKEKLSLQQIDEQLRTDHPDWKPVFIFHSESGPNMPYSVRIKSDIEREIWVNPYSGKVTGSRLHDSYFIGFVLEIHRTLLIPVAGRYIVGFSAIILVILIISGLRLWIPKQWKHVKARLTIRVTGSSARVNYDLHQVLGLYFSPMIVLIALTGAIITFLAIVAPVMFLLSFEEPKSLDQILGSRSVYQAGAQTLSIDSVLAIAQRTIPQGELAGIGIPSDSVEVFAVYTHSPYITATGDHDFMYIDQYSGKVHFNTREDLPNTGKMYLNWVTPVHFGTFGGEATRVVAFIASLIPSVLFITGILVWYPRWKGKRKRMPVGDDETDEDMEPEVIITSKRALAPRPVIPARPKSSTP